MEMGRSSWKELEPSGSQRHRVFGTARITLHVPETLNDGTPVATERFTAYEDALIEIAGGYTLAHAIGAWQSSDGTIYREPLRLYSVDVQDVAACLPRVHDLALRIRAELIQIEVYVTVSPIEATGVTEHAVA